MTATEEMLQEMNGFIKMTGDEELTVPKEWASELELLRAVKKEYKRRLRRKLPLYLVIPEGLILDMFLQALRNRESELVRGLPPKKRVGHT
jgi:hypothetical protein